MPNYTNRLRDPDDALNMCRRYAIDPASNPDGYKPIFTRELPTKGDHGDFGGFRQTTLARKQRISHVHLDKKMEHKLDGVSCGAAGALQVRASLDSDFGKTGVPAYFLPWDNRGAVVQMNIPRSDSTDLDEHPCVFMTAALSGCSIIVKGSPEHPTIIHGGSGQKVVPYDANKFWKDFVEHLDSHPDPAIRHARSGRSVKEQATKSLYVSGMETTSPTGKKIKTTQHALDYQRRISKHYGDQVEIVDVIPWGAVFGVRKGKQWQFFLQENANILYYPRSKIRSVKKFLGIQISSSESWQRALGPRRIVSRPMALTAIFPKGDGKARVNRRFRSLLRSDQLSTAPNAFPVE
jgi:hypothetical protein